MFPTIVFPLSEQLLQLICPPFSHMLITSILSFISHIAGGSTLGGVQEIVLERQLLERVLWIFKTNIMKQIMCECNHFIERLLYLICTVTCYYLNAGVLNLFQKLYPLKKLTFCFCVPPTTPSCLKKHVDRIKGWSADCAEIWRTTKSMNKSFAAVLSYGARSNRFYWQLRTINIEQWSCLEQDTRWVIGLLQ